MQLEKLLTHPAEGDLADVVMGVDVKYTIRDQNGRAEWISRRVIFDQPDPDDFTEFNDLDPSQVEGWVTSKIGPETIEQWQQQLRTRVERLDEPTAVVPRDAPWLPGSGHFSDPDLHWVLVRDGEVVSPHMPWRSWEINQQLERLGSSYRYNEDMWECFHRGLVPWREPFDLGDGILIYPCRFTNMPRPEETMFQVPVAQMEIQAHQVQATWVMQDRPLDHIKMDMTQQINGLRGILDQQGVVVDLGRQQLRISTGVYTWNYIDIQKRLPVQNIIDSDGRIWSLEPGELDFINDVLIQRLVQLDNWHRDLHALIRDAASIPELEDIVVEPPGGQ